MKFLFFSHSGVLSGAELALADLTTELLSLGHEITVVVPEAGPLEGRLRARGVATAILPIAFWASHNQPSWRERARELRALPKMVRLARELIDGLRPDVICTNSIVPISGAIAARWAAVPHVWFVHELLQRSDPLAMRLPRRLIAFLVGALSVRVIVPSRCVAREYSPSKTVVRPPVCAEVLGTVPAPRPQADGFPALALVGLRVPV